MYTTWCILDFAASISAPLSALGLDPSLLLLLPVCIIVKQRQSNSYDHNWFSSELRTKCPSQAALGHFKLSLLQSTLQGTMGQVSMAFLTGNSPMNITMDPFKVMHATQTISLDTLPSYTLLCQNPASSTEPWLPEEGTPFPTLLPLGPTSLLMSSPRRSPHTTLLISVHHSSLCAVLH